jgi:hypothetical protein
VLLDVHLRLRGHRRDRMQGRGQLSLQATEFELQS